MDHPLLAVLFDLDGTLLDTAPDMVGALDILRRENALAPLPFDEARASVSHGSARLVRLGFPDAGVERLAALQRRYLEIYSDHLAAGTRLFPGMDAVLEQLTARRLALGIVTNKPGWLTEPLLEQLGLRARFACVVSGDSLSERKPHPLPLLHAAELAGVPPQSCVYVGDAERDMQAARAAGMRSLVATYGYLADGENWRAWGGDGAISAPAELLGWLAHGGDGT
ncbi:MAG TPA: phosphoglycolate phosphatase [Steroidobacteraceae bacterium]|nr:phosphoglycolate phosphatase [Steroidobacteraceae bacterium]